MRSLIHREKLLAKTGGVCAWCDIPLTPGSVTIDHIIPVSRKKGLGLENQLPACQPCNHDRGNMDALEYLNRVEKFGVRPNALLRRIANPVVQVLPKPIRIFKRFG